MKNIFIFLSVFICFSINSQSFNFLREWGTYVGGGGTQIYDSVYEAFIINNQNNVFLNASVHNQNSPYSPSYYSQFAISSGGYPFISDTSNAYLAEFSSNGTQAYGAYKGAFNGNNELLLAIDQHNNKYVAKNIQGAVNNLATSGAWLTSLPTNTTSTYVLYKYDSSGNVIYSTYLPNANQIKCLVQGNDVFVVGSTSQEIVGLSNPGVFQEHYQNYASANQPQSENGYYVKLSASGSKILGTYLPFRIYPKLYNGGLYFLAESSSRPLNVIQSFVTAGTFQQTGGKQILVKFNANTGNLVWGTRLGINNASALLTGASNLGVNGSGIFLYGIADSFAGSYFSTPGAFRTQISGVRDLFLLKFDDTGNRVWGTYFGGNDDDLILGSGTVALYQNKIFVGGNTWGSDNIATSGAFLTNPPNPANVGNVFFAGFDIDGNLGMCSYYGGPISPNGIFAEEFNTYFDDAGNLYLWGNTRGASGFATPNGANPNAVNPQAYMPFGFLVKFTPKGQEMSVSEADDLKDLVLYDNPNNGNFTLSGNVLAKQNCSIKIFDLAGRVLIDSKAKKEKTQNFSMKGVLSKGTYMINVLNENQKTIKVFKMIVK